MSMEGAAWSSLYKISTARGSDNKISRETLRRIITFASPYKKQLIGFVLLSTLGAFLAVATPVLAGEVVNSIVAGSAAGRVIQLALLIAAVAVADAAVSLALAGSPPGLGNR
jgi:ATP-binding cassette subfamily B protein